VPNTVTYIAIVERIPGKEFRAHFRDFPEVRVSHATIEGIGARSSQVLRAHVEQLLQAHEAVPRPTSVDAAKEDAQYRRGFLIQIDVDVPESHLYTRSRPRAEASPAEDETSTTPESPE
jgi:predicted RNase H-like HicB family nuclease